MTALLREVETTQPQGFSIAPYAANKRLQVVTLTAETVAAFAASIAEWPVQALEYKPFLRYAVADKLDAITHYSLGKFLNDTMQDRNTGAFLLQYEGQPDIQAGELRTE